VGPRHEVRVTLDIVVFLKGMQPNLAVNTDAHRQGFTRAIVAGYLTRSLGRETRRCADVCIGVHRRWRFVRRARSHGCAIAFR